MPAVPVVTSSDAPNCAKEAAGFNDDANGPSLAWGCKSLRSSARPAVQADSNATDAIARMMFAGCRNGTPMLIAHEDSDGSKHSPSLSSSHRSLASIERVGNLPPQVYRRAPSAATPADASADEVVRGDIETARAFGQRVSATLARLSVKEDALVE